MTDVTFIEQGAPLDEYGRGLYAVARSIVRALLDSLSTEDLTDLNCGTGDVTMRQLAKVVRLDRDKGMLGDGFEWAVHEAILGKEQMVLDPILDSLKKASKYVSGADPTSLLFGYERARYLGFVDAVVDVAGESAYLLPEGSGRPFKFGTWVAKAAKGKTAESELNPRIQQIWKTDLFLSCENDDRYVAATVKSNFALLEGGRGLRIGIVPESKDWNHSPGVTYDQQHKLWLVTLPDPNGFAGLFNDAYNAVALSVCTLGKQNKPPYYTRPSAKAQRVQVQMEKYPEAKVVEIEDALNDAAQQDLVNTTTKLVSVNAPNWLHVKQTGPKIIAPKPRFEKLD